jgi:hypothetical protein
LAGLGSIWPDLAEFGIGLDCPWNQAARIKAALVEAAMALAIVDSLKDC